MPPDRPASSTICVNAHIGQDTAYGAVIAPLYLSSTYKFKALDEIGPYDYGRGGNPNRDALASTLAQLEGGAGGVITASGLAAIDLVLNLLDQDALVIAPHDCYGGTQRLLHSRQAQGRLRVRFIDQSDGQAVAQAYADKPALVFIETPSNPLMRVVNVAALASTAKQAGAMVVCDNTFLSPVRQTPLALGADIVVHSTTKFINGHSDVVGGAVIAKTAELAKTLSWWANCTGVTGAPFDAYQTLRGLRTLHTRMDAQETNALNIAHFLHDHPRIKHVYYPGLGDDPGYELANTQQSGPGAILSFDLHCDRDGVREFLAQTQLFQLAESLGGTESLICHPASMTHRAMDQDARTKAGIGESLIRLSVGLERSEDQLAELSVLLSAL